MPSRLGVLALVFALALGLYGWKSSDQPVSLGEYIWNTTHSSRPRGTKAIIVLYSVDHCAICRRMRDMLDARHLDYRDRHYKTLSKSDLVGLLARSTVHMFPQLEINGQFFGENDEATIQVVLDALD
jgi:glutaredoxin